MATEHGIKRALKTIIGAGYNPQTPLDEMVSAWRNLLDDVTDDEIGLAAREYCREDHRWFPRPGQLRQMAINERVGRGEHLRNDDPVGWDQHQRGPCPTCGAVVRMLEPHEQVNTHWSEETGAFENYAAPALMPRLGILHDRKKHTDAGVPAVGFWR